MNPGPQPLLKTELLFFCLSLFIISCKKNKNDNPPGQPTLPDTLYAGWTKVGNISTSEDVNDVYFSDPSNGYATTRSGIYKSTDGGLNWSKISSDPDFINIAATGSKACFVNQGNKMYNTLDYGGSISATAYQSFKEAPVVFRDCFYTTANNCYAASSLYIWKSTDGGASFDSVYRFPAASGGGNSLFFFLNDMEGWISKDKLYKTTNGGTSWTASMTFAQAVNNSIHFTDSNNGFVTDSGHLYKTTDGGANWQRLQNFPEGVTVKDIHFFSPMKGVCATGRHIYTTNDGGNSWTAQVNLGSGSFIEVFFLDEHHGWACGYNGYVLRFNL